MILGLGVSHQPVNAALGVNMQSPTVALRRYATEVAGWLRGEGPVTHLPQEPAPAPVPLYLAAMTSPMVELAGELADGVMPFMWSAARVTGSKAWSARGRAKAPARGPLDMALGISTFIGDDIEAQRNAARANLSLVHDVPVLSADVSGKRPCGRGGKGGAGCLRRLAERSHAGCNLSDRSDFTLPRTARGVPRRWGRSADLVPPDRRRGSARGHSGIAALAKLAFYMRMVTGSFQPTLRKSGSSPLSRNFRLTTL